MADKETALVPLAPLDIASIPNLGHDDLIKRLGSRAEIRKALGYGTATLILSTVSLWISTYLWPHLSEFPLAWLVLLVLCLVAAPLLCVDSLIRLPIYLFRLVATRDPRGCLPSGSSEDLALCEGAVRSEADKWNRAYASCRAALENLDDDAPPELLRKIALDIERLAEMRETIADRIAALRERADRLSSRRQTRALAEWKEITDSE